MEGHENAVKIKEVINNYEAMTVPNTTTTAFSRSGAKGRKGLNKTNKLLFGKRVSLKSWRVENNAGDQRSPNRTGYNIPKINSSGGTCGCNCAMSGAIKSDRVFDMVGGITGSVTSGTVVDTIQADIEYDIKIQIKFKPRNLSQDNKMTDVNDK